MKQKVQGEEETEKRRCIKREQKGIWEEERKSRSEGKSEREREERGGKRERRREKETERG